MAAAAAAAAAGSGGVSKEEVVLIAREALAQYDADKTGKFDYALESAGGSVISTKCTESYNVKSARISVLGIPLWYPSNNPRTIIQVSMTDRLRCRHLNVAGGLRLPIVCHPDVCY